MPPGPKDSELGFSAIEIRIVQKMGVNYSLLNGRCEKVLLGSWRDWIMRCECGSLSYTQDSALILRMQCPGECELSKPAGEEILSVAPSRPDVQRVRTVQEAWKNPILQE